MRLAILSVVVALLTLGVLAQEEVKMSWKNKGPDDTAASRNRPKARGAVKEPPSGGGGSNKHHHERGFHHQEQRPPPKDVDRGRQSFKQAKGPRPKIPGEKILFLTNDCGIPIVINWIHPESRSKSPMHPDQVAHGEVFRLNTFQGHEFQVDEFCGQANCRSTNFVIQNEDLQYFMLTRDFTVVPGGSPPREEIQQPPRPGSEEVLQGAQQYQAEDETDPAEIMALCQAEAKKQTEDMAGSLTDRIVDSYLSCMEKGVALTLKQAESELSVQSRSRREMSAMLENYTCTDHTLESSPDIVAPTNWLYEKDGIQRTVHIKHKRPASQIHVIENFISEEECNAMEAAAEPDLHDAAVADGKGGFHLSEHRKAKQAGITVQWQLEGEGDHIARLSRRVYDYVNHVLDLDIREEGQEDLMSIQYFGRGLNDTEPDRYIPHCDGECSGRDHKFGARMATMVLYCKIPEIGGHTNFGNAGVHVKPEFGNGVFFSYIDPEKRVTDDGFTQHSGCPVYEGEKKIVTQWVRLGVDNEHPWHSFNTLGIPKALADAQ